MSLSIAIIGNTNHALMEFALEKTICTVPYDEILVFCDRPLKLSKKYNFYRLPTKFGLSDYSVFCMKKLYQYVKTDHCMTIQYDGFAANKSAWTDEFLNYDCIGPLISPSHPPMQATLLRINTKKSQEILRKNEWRTGGGGFNIKSKRFLEVCAKSEAITGGIPMENGVWVCDDLDLSYYHDELFERFGIKFAPVGLSLSFAAEITSSYNFSLGFHGWYNTALFLNEEELIFYMNNVKRNMRDDEKGVFMGYMIARHYNKAINEFRELQIKAIKNDQKS